MLQDLGNTNFSIHVRRAAFDRGATGQIILRAVRSLGIDARLNERNDLCVGPHKMSLSHACPYAHALTEGAREHTSPARRTRS